VGRFISEDPIGFNGDDENLYVYVGGDPVNADDPDGLKRRRRRAPYGVRKAPSGNYAPRPKPPNLGKPASACDCSPGNPDVQKLKKALEDAVTKMNNWGMRNPGSGLLSGLYNNLVSWGAGYKGCWEQALFLEGMLHGTPYFPYVDNWTFELTPNWSHTHWWIEAGSDNPNSPHISLDPWKNKFTCKCKNK
jgi:hypothetical protein